MLDHSLSENRATSWDKQVCHIANNNRWTSCLHLNLNNGMCGTCHVIHLRSYTHHLAAAVRASIIGHSTTSLFSRLVNIIYGGDAGNRTPVPTAALRPYCGRNPSHPLMERPTRFELATTDLEGQCSTNWTMAAF